MPKLPQHIEERFDKEFEDYGGEYSNTLDAPRSLVKSFIATILEEEKERIIKEIDSMRDDDSCECDNCHRWRKYYQSNKRR